MARDHADWRRDHQLWIEAFVLLNFAGLVGDIFLAHSENQFRRAAEYVPLYFSMAATVALAAALALRNRMPGVWRDVGHLVGWLGVGIGLAGVIFHLDSRFFYERTIRGLTYGAPFAAPLAYTGLGLLLIVNRLVAPDSREWAQWVLLLALGGFAGNFVFSLSDHAQNGFFNPLEWVPVVSSAFAIGCLAVPFIVSVDRGFIGLCACVLAVQALIGVIGFALHAEADLRRPGRTLFERVLGGAPPMAPLLFPNLVTLGGIGLWALAAGIPPTESRRRQHGDPRSAPSSP
ncbi:MAG TPA: hypothetical protein VEU08_23780 [Vicinamibacterales bacterium]|nr:hypothetical protein [Vicinamibacterales bacterium]